jgi:hypothetical protein
MNPSSKYIAFKFVNSKLATLNLAQMDLDVLAYKIVTLLQ